LTTLRASTLLSGGHLTETTLYDLHVDLTTDHVYAVGYATANGFPVTPNAFASNDRGVHGSVLVAFSHSLSALAFSSGYGGYQPTGNMRALALTAAPSGELYFAGYGGYNAQDDFPSTPGAFRRTAAGGRDGYVARITPEGPVR